MERTVSGDNVFERVTGAYPVIMSDHENIHKGEGFNAWSYEEGVADNGYAQLEFRTHATRYVHMKAMLANAEGLGLFEVLEAPTLTTGATPFVPVNTRRVGTPTASLSVLKTNPTGVSAGTVIRAFLIGAGKDTGGPQNIDTELVLKQDTTYIFRVQNLAGSAKALSLFLFWYEEAGA